MIRAATAASLLVFALASQPLDADAQTPLRAPWDLPPPPPLTDPNVSSARTEVREPSAPSTAARIGFEALGGFTGLLASAVGVTAVGCAMSQTHCPFAHGGGWNELPYVILASWVLALPAGVTLAGNLAGGDGGFGWSLLGTTAGLVVSVPLGVLIANGGSYSDRTGRQVAAATLIFVLPYVGAVLGYELSPSSAHPARPRSARMQPSLMVSVDGAIAGASFTF